MSQNGDPGRYAVSERVRELAGEIEGSARRIAELEDQIDRIHVYLDHVGVAGEFAEAPASERVLSLCRWVVQTHGQYDAGSEPRARR